jgi:transposase
MQGQVQPDGAQPSLYVGIDVCKAHLDVHFHPLGKAMRVMNDRTGMARLKRELAKFPVAKIVMEATGKYHRAAHRSLHAAGLSVAVVNPLRARLFAEAIGALAKTDGIDARVLALIGERLAPDAAAPPSEAMEALQEAVRARQAAMADRAALLNRRGAAVSAILRDALSRLVAAIDEVVAELDAEIARVVASDEVLARRRTILTSIPGIGQVAAIALIVDLSEMGDCSGKAASALAGLAPYACDSGGSVGQRRIRGGRSALRMVLYMSAVSAARSNADLRNFYKRLRLKGKAAKIALTAVMRKLVVLANTLIKEDRLWQPVRP